MGKRKQSLYAAIWLTSLIITWSLASKYYSTTSFSSKDKTDQPTKRINEKSNNDFTAQSSNTVKNTPNKRIHIKPIETKVNAKELLSPLLNQVDFKNEDFIIRNVRLMTLFLEDCNTNELIAILENIPPEKNENWNILKLLAFSKLADFEPEKALSLSHELDFEKNMLRPEFFESWSIKEPLKALAYLQNNPTNQDDSYSIIFKNLSKRSYKEALFELSNIHENNKAHALRGIAKTLISPEDYTELLTYSSKEDGGEWTGVINEWTLKSPLEAMHWAKTQENGKTPDYSESVTQMWLTNYPEKAADWLIENENNQSEALDKIVRYWDYEKAHILLKYLNHQPQSLELDNAYLKVIDKNYSHDHANTLRKIKSATVRKEAVTMIYEKLIAQNAESAAAFLNKNNDLTDIEKEILKNEEREDITLDLIE